MATETELFLEKALKDLLQQQENERKALSMELESLRAENALIQQQYNEISNQLEILLNSINRLSRP